MARNKELKSIGIIPDGNRRYAHKKGISLQESYKRGFEKGEEVFKWCLDHPTIENVVIYALSTENLNREDEELEVLYELFGNNMKRLSESIDVHENGINVEIVGEKESLKPLEDEIKEIEDSTGSYDNGKLRVAMGYGGRKEIVEAARKCCEEGEEFSEENIKDNLYVDFDLDLVVRTGGYQRLSNFQIWQASYAELFFTGSLWPEFSKREFQEAVDYYNDVNRKFGR